jgi:iron complex outermembrane receptor protein
VDGVEIDGSISPFEGFRITGGLAWINSDLKSGVAPPTLPDWGDLTNPVDPSQDLPFSPEWKYSITPSYTLPLAENLGEVTLAATWSWTSDYVGGSGSGKVDSWGILNLNANWDHVFGSPVDLSFFGTNVLNEEYYTMAGDLRESALGVEYANVGEPRMYGVRLRYSFGGQAH